MKNKKGSKQPQPALSHTQELEFEPKGTTCEIKYKLKIF